MRSVEGDVFANAAERISSGRTSSGQLSLRLQLPSTKSEEWRYTNLAPYRELIESNPAVITGAGPSLLDSSHPLLRDANREVSQGDGYQIRHLTREQTKKFFEADATFAAFERAESAATKSGADFTASLNADRFSEATLLTATALSASVGNAQPVILHRNANNSHNHPRLIVDVKSGAKLQLIEVFTGPAVKTSYLSNPVTQVAVAENGELSYVRVCLEGADAVHLGLVDIHLQAAAKAQFSTLALQGALLRCEVNACLNGENIDCSLFGVTLGDKERHVDHYTVLDHAQPNCLSTQRYKGVYSQRAFGSFTGTIIVRQDAQKTNAIQSNNAVLLSTDAKVRTRPQLKIWADDVKCTHGATVGELDDEALFYLRARGINESQARAMLLEAFVDEAFSSISLNDEYKTILEELVLRQLKEQSIS